MSHTCLCLPSRIREIVKFEIVTRKKIIITNTGTYGRRAFAVAAPATWNSLSDELRNPDLHSATFRRNLKMFLFQQYLNLVH